MVNISSSTVYVLTGQLRNFESFKGFADKILEQYPVVVASSSDYQHEIRWLEDRGALVASLEMPTEPSLLPLIEEKPGVLQWWRFKLAIEHLLSFEKARGIRFPVIRKIRSDWEFDSPRLHLTSVPELTFDGLLAQSDITFGGRREYVIPLVGLWECSFIHFWGERSERYFPPNPWQILESDDSVRWYWSAVDSRTFDLPSELDSRISRRRRRKQLRQKIESVVVGSLPDANSLQPALGLAPWPAERAFAEYLNFVGTRTHRSPLYTGALQGHSSSGSMTSRDRVRRYARRNLSNLSGMTSIFWSGVDGSPDRQRGWRKDERHDDSSKEVP